MTRYLIKISHEEKKSACVEVVDTFHRTGSHLMTQADWGCSDDVHKAWIKAEMESKEEAMMLMPPEFRRNEFCKKAYRRTATFTPYLRSMTAKTLAKRGLK